MQKDAGQSDATQTDETLRRRKRFWIGLGLIMLLGFGIRIAFIVIRQRGAPFSTGDAYWYHFQAKLVAEGKGFLNPFQYYGNGVVMQGGDHPPGLVAILTIFNKIGIGSVQAHRVALSAVGTASIALIGLTGRRMVGPAVGLTAAFVAAVYPNIWINDGMLMVETVFIFGIALSFLCSYRYLQDRGRWNVVGISIGLTLAALTRPEAAVLFLFLLTPMLLRRKDLSWGERFKQLGIAALIPIACYGPWLAYNMTRFENPVLVSTGAGQSLVVANCPLTYDGEYLGYWNVACLLPPYLEDQGDIDNSELDPKLQSIAKDYMFDNLDKVPKVMAARIGRMWGLVSPRPEHRSGWIRRRPGGRRIRDRVRPGPRGTVVLLRAGDARNPGWDHPVPSEGADLPADVTDRARHLHCVDHVRHHPVHAGAEVAIVLFAAVTLAVRS